MAVNLRIKDVDDNRIDEIYPMFRKTHSVMINDMERSGKVAQLFGLGFLICLVAEVSLLILTIYLQSTLAFVVVSAVSISFIVYCFAFGIAKKTHRLLAEDYSNKWIQWINENY